MNELSTSSLVRPLPGEESPVATSPASSRDNQNVFMEDAPLFITASGGGLSAVRVLKSLQPQEVEVLKEETSSADSTVQSGSTGSVVGNRYDPLDFLKGIFTCTESAIGKESTDESDLDFYQDAVKAVVDSTPAPKAHPRIIKLVAHHWRTAGRMMDSLMRDHLSEYYGGCGIELKKGLQGHFTKKSARGKLLRPEIIDIGEGVSGAKLVTVDGVKTHVVKAVGLPEEVMKSKRVREALGKILMDGLSSYGEKKVELEAFMLHNVKDYFAKQVMPYYTGANREKLAELIGTELGVYVPRVEILRGKGGRVYSSHEFCQDAKSFHELSGPEFVALDQQSVQDLFILDMVLRNLDRHRKNALHTADGKLVPIDHALSLMGKESELMTNMLFLQGGVQGALPFSFHSDLTEASKAKIANFDLAQLLGRARIVEKLKVEGEVKRGLRERVGRAKEAIKVPGVKMYQLIYASLDKTCLQALQEFPGIGRYEIAHVMYMNEASYAKHKVQRAAVNKIQKVVKPFVRHAAAKKIQKFLRAFSKPKMAWKVVKAYVKKALQGESQ